MPTRRTLYFPVVVVVVVVVVLGVLLLTSHQCSMGVIRFNIFMKVRGFYILPT
jgi:hypothetical protein